jgi:Tfp pilus assembly protein PilP
MNNIVTKGFLLYFLGVFVVQADDVTSYKALVNMNILKEPSSSSQKVGHVKKGDKIQVYEKIDTNDGKTWLKTPIGYIVSWAVIENNIELIQNTKKIDENFSILEIEKKPMKMKVGKKPIIKNKITKSSKKVNNEQIKPIGNPFTDFSNHVSSSDSKNNYSDIDQSLPLIQRYPLYHYALKGTLSSKQDSVALVVVKKSGKYYYMKKGDKIGNENGVIKRITNDRIDVKDKNGKISSIRIERTQRW